MCPAHQKWSGKRKGGKATIGNRDWRAALMQVAWTTSQQKSTYLAVPSRR
jgi:hypothetical protein